MKTLQEWEESDLDLDQYLTEPCEIDEALYNEIAEVVPPAYCLNGLVQGGDPIRDVPFCEGVLTYDTVMHLNGRFFYLGELPEFKTEN